MSAPAHVSLGTVVVDRVRRIPGFAAPGEKRVTAPPRIVPGGVALNHLAWSAAMGTSTALLARLAEDEGGRLLREAMRAQGISTRWIVPCDEPTGTSEVLAGPGGERAIYAAPGTTLTTTPAQVRAHWRGVIAWASLLSTEVSMMPLPAVLEALRWAKRRAVDFDVPPEQALRDGIGTRAQLRRVLEAADILKATAEAAADFTGKSGLEASALALARLGRRRLAAVTDGARGAAVSDGRRTWRVPPFPARRPVDATGAGDAFFGGLIAGLLRGLGTPGAARLASACGAVAVATVGAFPPPDAWKRATSLARIPRRRFPPPARPPAPAPGSRVLDAAARALAEARGVPLEAAADLLERLFRRGGRLHLTGVGKTAYVAARAAATFSSWALPARFLDPVAALHGDLGQLDAGDAVLAVSKSGRSTELLALAPRLSKRRIPLLTLTASGDCPLARASGLPIVHRVPAEGGPWDLAPMASLAAQGALLDALCAELSARLGRRPADFARNHPGGALGRRSARFR